MFALNHIPGTSSFQITVFHYSCKNIPFMTWKDGSICIFLKDNVKMNIGKKLWLVMLGWALFHSKVNIFSTIFFPTHEDSFQTVQNNMTFEGIHFGQVVTSILECRYNWCYQHQQLQIQQCGSNAFVSCSRHIPDITYAVNCPVKKGSIGNLRFSQHCNDN